MLLGDKADVLASYTWMVDAERLEWSVYTAAGLSTECYHISLTQGATVGNDYDERRWLLFRPFHWTVWLAWAISIFMFGALLLHRCHRRKGGSWSYDHQPVSGGGGIPTRSFFFHACLSTMGQHVLDEKSRTVQVVTMAWVVLSLVMVTSHAATLTSMFTVGSAAGATDCGNTIATPYLYGQG